MSSRRRRGFFVWGNGDRIGWRRDEERWVVEEGKIQLKKLLCHEAIYNYLKFIARTLNVL